jgi:glyoxylate/hydroxypyruvate reductase
LALLFLSNEDDPKAWREELARRLPDLELREWPQLGDPESIEVALVWKPPPGALQGLPNLKAILSLGAGVDGFLKDDTLPDVPLCRMVDPSMTTSMSEYVLLAVLRHHRRFDRFERARAERRWAFELPKPAPARTVGILGLGVLGGDAARTLAARGFRVLGWSRTPKSIEGVICLSGEDGLSTVAAESEILVCLLPATPDTKGILNADLLGRLPEGACLVNAARGHHLVEEDLLAALDSGRLEAATLDVFHQEPLPPDHPFWNDPRILITPHVASYSLPSTGADQVAENIRRALDGRPLLHVVDRSRGY